MNKVKFALKITGGLLVLLTGAWLLLASEHWDGVFSNNSTP